jgi:hypothetical protein
VALALALAAGQSPPEAGADAARAAARVVEGGRDRKTPLSLTLVCRK